MPRSVDTTSNPPIKRMFSSIAADSDGDDQPEQCHSMFSESATDHCSDVYWPGKTKHVSLGNPVAVDTDGLLMDVDVQPVNDSPPTREDKQQGWATD